MNQICQQMEEIERLKAEAAEKEAKMQERIAYLERVSLALFSFFGLGTG